MPLPSTKRSRFCGTPFGSTRDTAARTHCSRGAMRSMRHISADPDCDLEAARRAVDATKGLIDDDPTALTAAGAATGFCGDQEGASVLLEQALALDPNNAWAWARWGWTGVYRLQPQQALERFEK